MIEKSFWEITGTDPTYDMNIICEIYKNYIEDVNRSDENKLILKKSFNRVMDEAFENSIKPQLAEVLKKIDNIYSDIHTRFLPDEWEKAFDSECFLCKIMFDYIRNEILAYFLYHEYISQNIWQIIDKHLHILRDYEHIKLTFPITFVQRIKQTLNGEMFFEYDRTKAVADDSKNPDDYIHDLFQLADMIESEQSEERIQYQIHRLESYGFYHVCFDVEVMNYLVKFDKDDERIAHLCEKLYNESNPYIRTCVGWALWHLDRTEEADELWQNVLAGLPDYRNAALGHARSLYENEYYEQAKDCVFNILEVSGENDETLALLYEINEVLMKNHLDIYEEQPDNIYEGIQYAWCLCQNSQWDDVIEFLLEMEEDESISYDMNMLLGRAYFAKTNYDQAIPYLQKWIKEMMLMPCDGSEEYKERLSRYPASLAIIAECYHEIGDLKKAVYFMEQSMHAYDEDDTERFKSMTILSEYYNEIGEFDKAFELSQKVIELDEYYVWAYASHQKAAMEINNTPAVIRDYSVLSYLAPDMIESYIYAALTYMNNNMYDDMEIVIDRAEANGVKSAKFDIMRHIISAGRAELVDLLDIEEDFDSMCAEKTYLREETQLIIRFYATIENRYIMEQKYDDALEYIDRIICLEPDNPYHKWEKADLYFRNDEDEKSLEIYKQISAQLKDNNSFLCEYAFCMQYNGLWEESLSILSELVFEEDSGMANAYMMRYYKHLYGETDLREHYEKAKMYINRQLKITPDNMFALQDRAWLIRSTEDEEEYDTAIKDCRKLIDAKYGDEIEHRKYIADLYIRKGESEKAIKELELIAPYEDNSDSRWSVYTLMSKAYIRINRRDLAEEVLRKAYKKTKVSYYAEKIADCCAENGKYLLSVSWYKKYMASVEDKKYPESVLSRVYFLANRKSGAEKICKKIFSDVNKENVNTARAIAWQLFCIACEPERAIECMEKTIKYTQKENLTDTYSALALFYRYINNDEKAIMYSEKLFHVMTEKYDGCIEKYLDVIYGLRNRIDNVVLYYIGMNEFTAAEKYLSEMLCGNSVCAWCSEPCCTDAYIRLAQLRIIQGDFDGMKKACYELLNKDFNNQQAKVYLEKIEELKKQYENYR